MAWSLPNWKILRIFQSQFYLESFVPRQATAHIPTVVCNLRNSTQPKNSHMNYRILIIFFIIFGCKINREKPPTIELNGPIFIECDSLIKKAVTDFKNGIREYDILGTVEMTEFEQFYWKYMKEKYDIVIKANDQPSAIDECYAESMNDEIEKEYGEDFIDRTINEARIEYKKQN